MQSPGLIDLQVNGYAGIDFNDAALTPGALDHALRAMLRSGVTTCLPTLVTADEITLTRRLAALDKAVGGSKLGRLMVPGFHLEGPFLNPAPGYAGCHNAAAMVAPDPALLHRLGRHLKRPILLLTLAPEQPGALALVAEACARGIAVAMGHTAADAETVAQAVQAGVTLSTHLGNALPQPQPKFLNPLMAQLAADALHASFIADGLHVPPPVLKVLVRAKRRLRSILVTDATAAAAAPPGQYGFAGQAIELAADGAVRYPGTASLAGSALRLDQAVRNVVAWGIADATSAVAMATLHPATVLTPALAHHGIALSPAAVTWTETLQPESVILGGTHFPAG
ncbi:N-acetylglucosamine-6-phosphate deacetylase [Rhodopila globiformis]|uniref:N-acetylglucosamine-6-phosphate deacetylase n=1 Tax=Rhodopila globiformis TaxID=1071 RepID=A0A2S6NPN5_RHOGL|nr:amidohydrolase family protein [Rhodopila globiformis]PPQ40866.1 N-acetylglucosamine-6-phosphate deacetylase [Rhodopila globiformis]